MYLLRVWCPSRILADPAALEDLQRHAGTVFDVVGKSIAVIELDSPKFGGVASRPNWKDKLEKLYAFDILFENMDKTKYPATVDSNHLNVIPAVIDKRSIQFDKKVHFIKIKV